MNNIESLDICLQTLVKVLNGRQVQPMEIQEMFQHITQVRNDLYCDQVNSNLTRLLVCGGRNNNDKNLVFSKLDELNPDIVINGGAKGIDNLSTQWAGKNGKPCIVMPAAWEGLGKSAGPIRNEWMLEYCKPNKAIAFPGGDGTKDMIEKSKNKELEVILV